jgi:hypothetical protein
MREEVQRAINLQERSRLLYSFAGPFATRRVVSSDPGAITGEASSTAKDLSQEIQVKELASAQQIRSDEIEKSRELPAGKFAIIINDKRVEFEFSGKVADLVKLLQSKSEGLYDLYSVQVDVDHVLFGMRSLIEGKKGEILFEDNDRLLHSVGLASNQLSSARKDLSFIDASLSPRNPTGTPTGEKGYTIADQGKALQLKSASVL